MSNYTIFIRPFGVHSILIEWPNQVDELILEDILQFKAHLINSCMDSASWEIIPAYNSLTLIYRQAPIEFDSFKEKIQEWYAQKKTIEKRERFLWKLPVCYDVSFGIDLEEVAKKIKITQGELITLHTQQQYTVYGIGFLPGFMYLGGLVPELEIVRRAIPRLKVEKGAVGIAGKQTGIYPQESPGGWNIVGNCPVSMFRPKNENPCFVSVGDKVQFYEIEKATYDLIKIENEVGVYNLEKLKIDA